jgi:hypothetical protein
MTTKEKLARWNRSMADLRLLAELLKADIARVLRERTGK